MTEHVVEMHYTIEELALLLRFSGETIRRRVKAGAFSPPDGSGQPDLSNIADFGGDIRVPASGVNYYIREHPLRFDPGIKARNRAELLRKIGGKHV